jgi:hypothetical protein
MARQHRRGSVSHSPLLFCSDADDDDDDDDVGVACPCCSVHGLTCGGRRACGVQRAVTGHVAWNSHNAASIRLPIPIDASHSQTTEDSLQPPPLRYRRSVAVVVAVIQSNRLHRGAPRTHAAVQCAMCSSIGSSAMAQATAPQSRRRPPRKAAG